MADRILALIRHGAYHQRAGAPSALQPFPLTETGEAQARACGAEVLGLLDEQGWRLDPVLHSSCQLRAWQTARIAGDVLSDAGHDIAEIRQDAALAERSVGSAANLTVDEIEAVIARDPRFADPPAGWKSDSDYCLPLQGAESLMMAGHRVAAHLKQIASVPADRPTLTLCFGHGASFRHAAHVLGLLKRERIAQISMYHARPLLLCYRADDTWGHRAGAWKPRHRTEPSLD